MKQRSWIFRPTTTVVLDYSILIQQPSHSQSSLHVEAGAPPDNFDTHLELARAGSPSNSAYSNSERETVIVRDYTPTPDLTAPRPGNRACTPNDHTAGQGFYTMALGDNKGELILEEVPCMHESGL